MEKLTSVTEKLHCGLYVCFFIPEILGVTFGIIVLANQKRKSAIYHAVCIVSDFACTDLSEQKPAKVKQISAIFI